MKSFVLCCLLAFSFSALANTHREAADAFLAAFEVKSAEERADDVVRSLEAMGVPTEDGRDRLLARLTELLSSDEYRRKMQNLHMEYLSEEELLQLAEMFSTPAGRKFLEMRLDMFARANSVLGEEIEQIFGAEGL